MCMCAVLLPRLLSMSFYEQPEIKCVTHSIYTASAPLAKQVNRVAVAVADRSPHPVCGNV